MTEGHPEQTKWRTASFGGEQVRITTNHWGIWGNGAEKKRVRAFTDGSVQKDVGRAGFAWCVEDDWMKKSWTTLHESRHRGYREAKIRKHVVGGGGQATQAKTSYTTELMAIATAIMNIPGSWDLEIVTDSQAAIKAIQRKQTRIRDSDWQLLTLVTELINKRKGKINLRHQRSHKKEWTGISGQRHSRPDRRSFHGEWGERGKVSRNQADI